jgi:hypothetical protein
MKNKCQAMKHKNSTIIYMNGTILWHKNKYVGICIIYSKIVKTNPSKHNRNWNAAEGHKYVHNGNKNFHCKNGNPLEKTK